MAIPALFDGGAQRSSVSDLVSNTFEVDDERVGGHANCHNQTGNACQREAVAHRPRQQRDHQVGDDRCNDQRTGGNDREAAVLPDQVEDDQQKADEGRPQTDGQVIRTDRRRNLLLGLNLEVQG